MGKPDQTLVLVGGGHSHAIALKEFGKSPLPGVRLILLTAAPDTAYSGMLPGHVAGFYSHTDCHIDLQALADFAQADFRVDQAVGLDLQKQQVLCQNLAPIDFDVVSIDIGSTPTLPPVPGAQAYSIPVKPIRQFLTRWEQMIEQVAQQIQADPKTILRIGIVGGGVGGVELSLAVQRHLYQVFQSVQKPLEDLEIHLFHRSASLLSQLNPGAQRCLNTLLMERGIQVHLKETVAQVEAHQVCCESGLTVVCDFVFWVTQASAPPWLQQSGLATDDRGFIHIHDTLQSTSHPNVFAAGDIATMIHHPRPKAGVFAVRQGKPLSENLRRLIRGQPLKPYIPQKRYLSLIGTSELPDWQPPFPWSLARPASRAIASWGNFSWQSPGLWNLKDWIDRRFMQRFPQK